MRVQSRRFIGSELKADINGATPADGDTFLIFPLGKHHVVANTQVLVTDADNTSIAMTLGYATTSAVTSANAFEASVNLNAPGITETKDDILVMPTDDYYYSMTIPSITNLDADTEFVITVFTYDISRTGITEAFSSAL
jgi:hypothetical protein